MTALLALITVVSWGTWIPLAQTVPGVPQRSRTFYVTVGNIAFAAVALVASGNHLSFGWREFWLPFAGAWSGRRGTTPLFAPRRPSGWPAPPGRGHH